MANKLMITIATGALMATGSIPGALAQTSPTPAPATSNMQTQPSEAVPGRPQFVPSEQADQFLASNFKGTDVMGPEGERIGTIDDILFSRDGKVVAYVVGVGGFLGIGMKEVALAPSSFQMISANGKQNAQLRLNLTKDDLKQAQAFKTQQQIAREQRQQSTTGAGSPNGMAPRPGSTNTPPSSVK
jgi:sporulation protein YlmC with PRC-barrel domain